MGIIFRCLVVLAIGAVSLSIVESGLKETDGDGILFIFFALCLYAGAACTLMGRIPCIIMFLGIRGLGCVGMAVWALIVTLISFVLLPIMLTWNVGLLLFYMLTAFFSFVKNKAIRSIIGGGITIGILGIVVYHTYDYVEKTYIIREKEVIVKKDDGRTELHKAVLNNDSLRVKMLIDIGACNVNQQDSDGNTALHLAASLGYLDCVNALLSAKNIDLNVRNKAFRTAFAEARVHNNKSCEDAIAKKMNISQYL